MAVGYNPRIVTDGLVLALDAANTKSTSRIFGSNVSLLLLGNGSNGSTTFYDYSAYNHSVTANGDAQNSTAQKKFGLSSMLFDGNGDYVSIGDDTSFDFGSGDFTIEFWVYLNSVSGNQNFIHKRISSDDKNWLFLSVNSSGDLRFWATSNSSTWDIADNFSFGNTALSSGQWYHIALVRNGTEIAAYVDGTKASNTITTSESISAGSYDVVIGGESTWWLNGYIDDLRITKGVARYTSNFTPPTSQLPYESIWTDVSGNGIESILFSMGSNTYDSSNGGAFVFDGLIDYIECGSSDNFAFGTGDYTIELWCKTDTGSAGDGLIHLTPGGSGSSSWQIKLETTNQITYSYSANSEITSSSTVSVGQWTQIVATRSGTALTLYINAVSEATGTSSANLNSTGALRLGIRRSLGVGGRYDGKISIVRLYKGKALTAAEVQQNYDANRGRYVLYPKPIVTSGLILHLDAANTSSYSGSGTTWTDLSNNSNNGTLTNEPTFSTDNGGAIVFDGTNDFVTLGTQINSDITTTDVTISFWAYIDSTAADEVFVSMETLNTNIPLIIWYDTSSTYEVQNTGSGDVGGGSTNVITTAVTDASSEKRFTTSNNALSANTWYNIAVVLDVTNNEFYTYINGVEEAKWTSNNTSGGIKSTTNDFRIGGGSPYLDGRISQFLVYTKALTAAEVLQNYNALKERY